MYLTKQADFISIAQLKQLSVAMKAMGRDTSQVDRFVQVSHMIK